VEHGRFAAALKFETRSRVRLARRIEKAPVIPRGLPGSKCLPSKMAPSAPVFALGTNQNCYSNKGTKGCCGEDTRPPREPPVHGWRVFAKLMKGLFNRPGIADRGRPNKTHTAT
jgi:hypothetical protein